MDENRLSWTPDRRIDSVSNDARRKHWHAFKEAYEELSHTAGSMGPLVQSLRLHERHCPNHPHDKAAARRLEAITAECEDAEKNTAALRTRCFTARTEYLEKVLGLVGVPPDYLSDACMNLMGSDGSVRIGDPDRWPEYWVLDAGGMLWRTSRE